MDVAEKKNCHESIIMNKRTTIIGVSRRLFVKVAQCLTRVLYVLFGGGNHWSLDHLKQFKFFKKDRINCVVMGVRCESEWDTIGIFLLCRC